MKKIRVNLGTNSYDIIIGAGELYRAGEHLKAIGFSGRVVVITNPTVRAIYGDLLGNALKDTGFGVEVLEVPDGEENKTLANAGNLYIELSNRYAERRTPIISLGGGVIGDLAGFVAATYMRGVPLIHIPTTLLSQVDSSVGGKVAVNHAQLKNEIGAFYQPKAVVSDINTLKTLPPKIFSDGMAEVIKHGVIRDKEFFDYLEENMAKIKAFDDAALEHIVARSVEIKADVVVKDERESGLRAILNYGHTAAHAIESLSDFKINHGSAVAIGMIVAARISTELGMFPQEEADRLEGLVKRAELPVRVPDFNSDDMYTAMQHDKKVSQGKIRFVLLKGLGEAFVTDNVAPSLVKGVLEGLK